MTTFCLVHGAWHGGWCFERLAPELEARGGRVVAPDLPCEDVEAGVSAYADVVDAALGDAEDVVLVGHSLGGLVDPARRRAAAGEQARLPLRARPHSGRAGRTDDGASPGAGVPERDRAGRGRALLLGRPRRRRARPLRRRATRGGARGRHEVAPPGACALARAVPTRRAAGRRARVDRLPARTARSAPAGRGRPHGSCSASSRWSCRGRTRRSCRGRSSSPSCSARSSSAGRWIGLRPPNE